VTAPIDKLPWQPIETARKDCMILVRFAPLADLDSIVDLMQWSVEDNALVFEGGNIPCVIKPTHWLDISGEEQTE